MRGAATLRRAARMRGFALQSGTPMRRFLLALALTLGAGTPAFAQAPVADGDYLLIDKTIKTFYGQIGYVPGTDAAINALIVNQSHQMAQLPGISPGAAAAGGAVGGLVGGIMIEASIQAARNREIATIRAPLNDGALKQRVLDSLAAAFAEVGHPIARRVLAPDANPNFLKQAVGQAKPATVFMFDAKAGPIVSLSGDNRRVVIYTDVAVYERRDNRYTQTRTVRLSYVSRPAPDGQDPIAYWAGDNARPVLDAVDDGMRRLVRAGFGPDAVDAPKVDDAAKTTLLVNGKPEEFRGVVLHSGDGFVTLATAGEWLRIVPAELPPVEAAPAVAAPVEPAPTAPAASDIAR